MCYYLNVQFQGQMVKFQGEIYWLVAVIMNIAVVWEMTLCSVVVKYSTNVSSEITALFLKVEVYAEHVATG